MDAAARPASAAPSAWRDVGRWDPEQDMMQSALGARQIYEPDMVSSAWQ
jgi:hypothetical protein